MLSDRNVRAVVLARFVSRVGGEAAFFVGIWGKAAFELEATPAQLAAVMAALGVASLIGASIAGVLVDRFDPRRVVIWGELAFVPAALALVFTDTIPSMVVATFVLGLPPLSARSPTKARRRTRPPKSWCGWEARHCPMSCPVSIRSAPPPGRGSRRRYRRWLGAWA